MLGQIFSALGIQASRTTVLKLAKNGFEQSLNRGPQKRRLACSSELIQVCEDSRSTLTVYISILSVYLTLSFFIIE